VNWSEIFGFSMSPWELVLRGTLIYWFLFLTFRIILRRDAGTIGMADVLLIVLLADAAQNAMSGQYGSVTEGAVLVLTLVFWNVAIDYCAYRFPALRPLVEAPPLKLIDQGRIQYRNLRREFMSTDELMAKLREHGVDDVQRVKFALMESDGTVTVVLKDGTPTKAAAAKSLIGHQ
jgi:uncharacterized membrane protein YcaP (DUF421 family)